MNDLNLQIPGLAPEWNLALQVFAVLMLTAAASFTLKRILLKVLHGFQRTETRWDDILVKSMKKPITWGVWFIGVDIAIGIIHAATPNPLFELSDPVRDVGVLVCLAWFLLRLVSGAEQEIGDQSDSVDRHTAEAIGKLVRLAIIITAALMILQTLGFSISGVLAMGGIGGIAVGFAAKDLLANFFGGLLIYLDRPFSIGDWIRSPDRKIEGVVEKIGWRVTVIRNFESQPMYVPNSVFTSVVVENPSRMANRRLFETIGLRYRDLASMKTIVSEVTELLNHHDDIDNSKTLMVNFNAFADSSVDFFFYCFTRTTDWKEYHQVKQKVMLEVAEIIGRNHAEIAFPTTTIDVPQAVKLEQN